MTKKRTDTIRRSPLNAALVKETAQIAGVSVRSVQRVLNGQQVNQAVMSTYMELWERYPQMVEEVKRIVPFYLSEFERLDAIAAANKQLQKTA